ncbi:unnamed protein product [Lymnaea stagnalis]|uniref:Cysteine dioxygenase n=1 Tax=Lymnaea stagnalis TaxID=6523 RepID=A0AAV2H8S1_LYMST
MDNSINESSLSAREHLLFNERDNNLEHLQREMNKINWDDLKQAVKNFRGILQSYHSNKDDWNIFCKSKQEEGYSRNEIIVVPNMYSLVLMVWKPFKGNFIHDHGGSHGLVKILQGRLVEEHYSYHQEKEMGKRLEKENEITLEYNEVNDHNCFKDFHRMYNPDAKEVAVSLHVYAPPLEKCRLINNESNDTEVVQMKCTSRRGEMTTLTENNELSDDSAQVSFGERKSPVSPDVKCRVYEPESKSSYNIEPTLHTADGVRRRVNYSLS